MLEQNKFTLITEIYRVNYKDILTENMKCVTGNDNNFF
jgi:hypothetical protein